MLSTSFTIISGLLTVLSIIINLWQWRVRRQQYLDSKMRIESMYNELSEVSRRINAIFKLSIPSNRPDNQNERINSRFEQIRGIAESSIQNIISFCKHKLSFTPYMDLVRGKIESHKGEMR